MIPQDQLQLLAEHYFNHLFHNNVEGQQAVYTELYSALLANEEEVKLEQMWARS